MKKINLSTVLAEEDISPKGRFHRFRQDIARAMSAGNGEMSRGAKCPFEVELVRLPPRAANWPYHSHSAQWEFFMIVSGHGQVRTPAGKTEVCVGDCFAHPPNEPHQLINTGAVDLIYYVIADDPPSDCCHYPDSNKWWVAGQPSPVRVQPAGYYEGEE